jgi:hypothetical protein
MPLQGAYRKDIIEGYLGDLNLAMHGAAKRVVGEVIANEVSYGWRWAGLHAAAAAPNPQFSTHMSRPCACAGNAAT